MIKGLTSSSSFITVSGGGSSGPYISPGSAGAGIVRYNPNTQNLEVNDGNCWIEIPQSYASVDLSYEAADLLNWAREKRNEESRVQEMIEKYPALKKAKENYDLIWNIVKDEHKD